MRVAGHARLAILTGLAWTTPALAQSHNPPDIAALKAELEALRQRQDQLAAEIERLSETARSEPGRPVTQASAQPVAPASTATAAAVPAAPDRLAVSGDLRLRYEINPGNRSMPDRHRWALRGRLRAQYRPSNWLKMGAQITTGDAGDPNSSDVTLGTFLDDFPVSLDQVYVSASHGGFTVTGGKFAVPFQRSDLVWDGDVNPQGLSVSYDHSNGPVALGARLIFSPIEESVGGKDSRMIGGQAVVAIPLASRGRLKFAGAYYDYRLSSTAAADSGDIRGNRFEGAHYLSDYNLLNASAIWELATRDKRWPITVTGDYVRNLGAPSAINEGWLGEIAIGRANEAGDWRFAYGYMQAGQDAVFAAFSHDNIAISSNYRLHQFAADYTARAGLVFNATLYRYRHLIPSDRSDFWRHRVRLNAIFSF